MKDKEEVTQEELDRLLDKILKYNPKKNKQHRENKKSKKKKQERKSSE